MLFHIKVYGIVQGVGFRPFISRLAATHNILGTVCNKGPYVEIYAQGSQKALEEFQTAIRRQAPERAAIIRLDSVPTVSRYAFNRFDIIDSAKEEGTIFVSPDIATCDKCREELFDPMNRRYLHPFINCTSCGPRLTILDDMPYDRERTSMKEFPMCHACQAEYTSEHTRRYDAQPICCNNCGPEVYLINESRTRGRDAIIKARKAIQNGEIIAIKGIGGFHLCCDAKNETTVKLLRKHKNRPTKPFAVMMRDVKTVRRECVVNVAQEDILSGYQKPILLLEKQCKTTLASSVSPNNPKIGVMLPYAPIQMLLFDYPDGIDISDTLIMTSGNPSGAPICHTDEEAIHTLGNMCSLILSNNRRIRLRADDTVMDWFDNKPYMVRRSRGFSPLPFSVNEKIHGQVLAIGGELKNTFTISRDNLIYPSPYIGNMSDLRTLVALKDSISLFESLFECNPEIIAYDLHPHYNTTMFAKKLGIPLFPVQHHYAHILSCMVENAYNDPVIGVAFDGTGYGTDGTIWGGEILQADYFGFSRLASIEPWIQAGGDNVSRDGWRNAISLLYHILDDKTQINGIVHKFSLCSTQEFNAQYFMLNNGINCIPSTSAGRLFDAISALLGIKRVSTFEGEASMALQFAAEEGSSSLLANGGFDEYSLKAEKQTGRLLLPTTDMFQAALNERLSGINFHISAYHFHVRLANSIASACYALAKKTGIRTVALSGGVFQNLLLVRLVKEQLNANHIQVLTHRFIPPNDGGICLGQAAAALFHLNRKKFN